VPGELFNGSGARPIFIFLLKKAWKNIIINP